MFLFWIMILEHSLVRVRTHALLGGHGSLLACGSRYHAITIKTKEKQPWESKCLGFMEVLVIVVAFYMLLVMKKYNSVIYGEIFKIKKKSLSWYWSLYLSILVMLSIVGNVSLTGWCEKQFCSSGPSAADLSHGVPSVWPTGSWQACRVFAPALIFWYILHRKTVLLSFSSPSKHLKFWGGGGGFKHWSSPQSERSFQICNEGIGKTNRFHHKCYEAGSFLRYYSLCAFGLWEQATETEMKGTATLPLLCEVHSSVCCLYLCDSVSSDMSVDVISQNPSFHMYLAHYYKIKKTTYHCIRSAGVLQMYVFRVSFQLAE